MKVLITGNLGYIGPKLGTYLLSNGTADELVGVDIGFFLHNITSDLSKVDMMYATQLFKDVRDISASDLDGCDAVVALAAVSNDPMGNEFTRATNDINCASITRLASKAKDVGVRRFVFASSCSVYGAGGENAKNEADPVKPLTHYARSKIQAENQLIKFADDNFKIVALRFATACGVSDRTRLDLVLNDFVWELKTTGKIKILSDGSPLRPLIDVTDMCRAISWAIHSEKLDNFNILNCGYNTSNFSVKELAELALRFQSGEVEINTTAEPDARSYRVDFSKYQALSGFKQPLVPVEQSIEELFEHFEHVIEKYGSGFKTKNYFKRLPILRQRIKNNMLNTNLRRVI